MKRAILCGIASTSFAVTPSFRGLLEERYIYDISLDGSSAVGFVDDGVLEAFHWTEGTGMVGLGDLPGGDVYSVATNVSADGSVVVGWAGDLDGEAFRWTEETGMVGLGYVDIENGYWSNALSVSGDGSVIVGISSASGLPNEAFIWTEEGSMRGLKEVLINGYGLDLTGWTLNVASRISDDGLTIVGKGINPAGNYQSWIATVPEPATLLLFSLGGLVLRKKYKW